MEEQGTSLAGKIDRSFKWTEDLINASRYMLVLPYLGLIIMNGFVIAKFFQELFDTLQHFIQMSGVAVIISTLMLIDIIMAANLALLIARGSYSVFINERKFRKGEQRPQFLNHMSTGILKEKLAGSLMGVSSVYLVQKMIDIGESKGPVNWSVLGALAMIHSLLIIGVFVLNKANQAEHLEQPDPAEAIASGEHIPPYENGHEEGRSVEDNETHH